MICMNICKHTAQEADFKPNANEIKRSVKFNQEDVPDKIRNKKKKHKSLFYVVVVVVDDYWVF